MPFTSVSFPDVHGLGLAVLPKLLPGETIYSWCARYQRVSSCCDPGRTSRLLFGDAQAGLRHDIPYKIGAFVERTEQSLGNGDFLLKNHTVFGLYAKFLPLAIERKTICLLMGGENSTARGLLGLKQAGTEFRNLLKYCPECAAEQIRERGHAWWRVTQQLPTAFACLSHQRPLLVMLAPERRGVLQDFWLPGSTPRFHSGAFGSTANSDFYVLRRITEWGETIWHQGDLHLTDENLRWTYLLQAKKNGWMAFDGSVRMLPLRDAFLLHHDVALGCLEEEFLGALRGRNGGFLSQLLRKYPGRRHLLKHVLLMDFLFASFQEFLEAFLDTVGLLKNGGEGACIEKLRAEQAELVQRVRENKESVSRAAANVGVNLTSANRFLDLKTPLCQASCPTCLI